MKSLQTLLQQVETIKIIGDSSIFITDFDSDSRNMTAGYLFVAVKGTSSDGHKFIDQSIERGAVAVVCEELPTELKEGICYVLSPNSPKALGIIASNYYDNPSKKLKLVGVTGTNGKTTNVTLLYNLFKKLGYKTGMISTVENRVDDRLVAATLTTPRPVDLYKIIAEMVTEGCTHCFMEVSSHSTVQERIAGLSFTGAVFTNITHDHLDFHKTFDNYIKAKKKFFDEIPPSAFALVNIDDKRGMVMLQNCVAKTQKTFAIKEFADFKAKILENTLEGLHLEIDKQQVWFKMIGSFNAYNLMSVYGTALLLGEEKEAVLTALSEMSGAAGRFEQFANSKGTIGIVDYAHTPDALENVLKTIQDIKKPDSKVIAIIGCGGNRDKEKRPLMGAIAAQLSDVAVFTSDNPRNEDPNAIIQEMQAGLDHKLLDKITVIPNRKDAIIWAAKQSKKHDIILVAGKGHENYQEITGIKYPFDDKEVLKEAFEMSEVLKS